MAIHVADIATAGSFESCMREGFAAGYCVAANFATDEATTLAAIAARSASVKALAGQSGPQAYNGNSGSDNYVRYQRFIAAVKRGFILDTAGKSSVMIGGNEQAIYDLGDSQSWQPGFSGAL